MVEQTEVLPHRFTPTGIGKANLLEQLFYVAAPLHLWADLSSSYIVVRGYMMLAKLRTKRLKSTISSSS